MKSLCITGANDHGLNVVAQILRHAGMSQALPVKREEPIDMAFWHDQVANLLADDGFQTEPVKSVGRLWDQLASEIFVANLSAKVWGWADTRSTWLLDYWANFEPRLNFVLVCQSPQQMLASVMSDQDGENNVDAIMATWQAHHQELLRFYNRNPQRCLLVDAQACADNPSALIELCNKQWKLRLVIDRKLSAPTPADPLASYLAQNFCNNYPLAGSLQAELIATMEPLASHSLSEPPSTQIIISSHRKALADTIRNNELEEKLAAVTAKLAEADKNKIDPQKIEELEQENQLLVLQLHQVQEELESNFVQYQTTQNQLTKVQKDQKQTSEQTKASISQNTELEKKLAAVTAKLAEAEKNKIDPQKIQVLEQENQLLLLQLHQVQEELENYFLQHQSAQKELKAAERRWQRVLRRDPGYCDYESIEILSVDQAEGGSIRWKLKDLDAGGRNLAELEFSTIIEKEIAGFTFSRQPNTAGPLLRWPAVAANQTEITIIPVGTAETIAQRSEILKDLALSDLDLLKVLAGLLLRALDKPETIQHAPDIKRDDLKAGLAKFVELIEKLSNSPLRYDQVSLKQEQINPDYEHLWLHLDNVLHGGKRWPTFGFRVSCANVRSGLFGSHPKLEFPEETGREQIEGWFAEAQDDFGQKFELRFAMPQSMDVAAWQRLTDADRKFAAALVGRLPSIIQSLEKSNIHLKRPIAEWLQMAREMQRILAKCLAPRNAPAPRQADGQSVQAPRAGVAATLHTANKKIASSAAATAAAPKPKRSPAKKSPASVTALGKKSK